MGSFRYRRSIRMAPGVRLNVSKRGISSVSFGGPGATLNMGRRGTRSTLGLPGTGLSYTTGRSGSGSSLVLGLALAGLVGLIVAAARGSRAAKLTLAALGAGFLALLIASGSDSGAPNAGSIASPPPPSQQANVSQDDAMAVPVGSGQVQTPLVPRALAAIPAEPSVGAVTTAPATPPAASNLVLTVTGANIRSSPSMFGTVLRQLPAKASLVVIGRENGWAYVRFADETNGIGWVYGALLRPGVQDAARATAQ